MPPRQRSWPAMTVPRSTWSPVQTRCRSGLSRGCRSRPGHLLFLKTIEDVRSRQVVGAEAHAEEGRRWLHRFSIGPMIASTWIRGA